jgi:uncharacterized C2H2 Zn-finger protein
MEYLRGRCTLERITKVEIRCTHCGTWFDSPMSFGSSEAFNTSTLVGNTVQCPRCGKMTGCNKENIRHHSASGGFVGNDTV